MNPAALAMWVIGVPCLGCFTLPLAAWISPRVRNAWAMMLAASTCFLSLVLGGEVLAGQGAVEKFALMEGINLVLIVDGLSVFMAMVSSFISLAIVMYSLGYIRHEDHQTEYYLMLILFVGAMMGLVFSGNLFFMYVFWEIAGICCWRLIGFYRAKDHVVKAGKAFLVTAFGALMMLFGFILIYVEKGTVDLTVLHGASISNLAVLLILFGILSKSATLPLHTWLPDAGVAPSPVTALLHAAVLVKIGIYGFARIFCFTMPLPDFWRDFFPIVAGASAIVSAGAAFIETDIKRIIAYSTVSQIGFILLGLSIGSPLAVAGALLYILMHGLAKAGLFLCAGIVEHNTGVKDIRKMGGLIQTMPITAVCFALCAFSIMGIPPFGGFFAKYQVVAGAVQANRPLIAGMFMVGACMTILYLFRVFNMVFLAPNAEGPEALNVKEKSPTMLITVVILAGLSLAGGFLVKAPMDFISVAQQHMVSLIR